MERSCCIEPDRDGCLAHRWAASHRLAGFCGTDSGGWASRAVEFGTAEYGLAGGAAAGGVWRCDLRPAARRDDLLHRTVVRPPGADLETRGYLTGWHRRWSLGRFSG